MDLLKDREEFKKWADTFRKAGLKSIKVGEVTLEFIPEALLPESEYKKKLKLKEVESKAEDILKEQFLIDNWSTNVEVQG